jgi:DNA-binding PadR family transcriptional regulator
VPDLNATAASLLGFLHGGPKTGWDLVCAVEISVGNFWNVTRSQVYRELKTLAEAGLIEEGKVGKRDKVPYAITKAGRAAFAEWIGREPGPDLLRLPVVLTVFFGDRVEPKTLRRYLLTARLRHEKRLETYLSTREGVTAPYPRATLELGIAYEKTLIAWLDGLPWIREPKSSQKRPRE